MSLSHASHPILVRVTAYFIFVILFMACNKMLLVYSIEKGSFILSMKTSDISDIFIKGVVRPEHYYVEINDLFYCLVFLAILS